MHEISLVLSLAFVMFVLKYLRYLLLLATDGTRVHVIVRRFAARQREGTKGGDRLMPLVEGSLWSGGIHSFVFLTLPPHCVVVLHAEVDFT